MTTTYTNNAEGGSNGTTVTTGNSGGASGTAFDSITNTHTFSSSSPYDGSLSYSTVTTGTAATMRWNWTSTTAYVDMVFRHSTLPAANKTIACFALAGNSYTYYVWRYPDGSIRFGDG